MKEPEYDYLLIGAGLFNAILAFEAAKDGKRLCQQVKSEQEN